MSNSTKYCVTAMVCALILAGGYILVNHGKDDRCARGDLSVEKSPLQDEDTLQARWDAMTPEEREEYRSRMDRPSKSLAKLEETVASLSSSLNKPHTNSVQMIQFAEMPEISIPDISGTGEH